MVTVTGVLMLMYLQQVSTWTTMIEVILIYECNK